jgi:hypothetical protein
VRILISSCYLALFLFGCDTDENDGDAVHRDAAASHRDAAAGSDAASRSDAARDDVAHHEKDADTATGDAQVANVGAERHPCNLDTGWRGDDQCTLPPDPSEGFQLHFGPANYDDPEEVARYTLPPDGESMLCTYIVTPNDEKIFYDDWQNKLRPGSHHMIITLVGEGDEKAGVACSADEGASNQGIVGGNTTTVMPLADVAPENVGLARTLPAHARVSMQLHFFNTTGEPLLMEAWQNIYYKDEKNVQGISSPLESLAGLNMSVEPGTTEIIHGSLVAPTALRVLELYSHHHDHTLRFSAYLRRKGETEGTQIYESYDWKHPLLLPFDSVHDNPVFDRKSKTPGGISGDLELEQGDAIDFECEIQNNDLDTPLHFANQAHTAEMCILRGYYTPSMDSEWSSFSL